jgi:cytochrome c556
MSVKLIFTIIFFLIAGNAAFADHNHQHKKPVTIQMKTQHHTMDSIGEQWNVAQKSIKAGDLICADKALQTILDKSSYMEKFEGYKNDDRRAEFISEYHLFVDYVKKLRVKISRQDTTAVHNAMQEVQNSCKRCHAIFK